MPIDSNDAEDNEEREGDFYSHAHTWSFLLVSWARVRRSWFRGTGVAWSLSER
jgi:hypothetical protein